MAKGEAQFKKCAACHNGVQATGKDLARTTSEAAGRTRKVLEALAGGETTDRALANLWWILAQHPDVLAAVRRDQAELGRLGDLEFQSVTADYRHTRRESYGDANRMGAEVRWLFSEKKLQTGFGFHRVDADDVLAPGAQMASYGLSHNELRAWATYELGRYFASVDGISKELAEEIYRALH